MDPDCPNDFDHNRRQLFPTDDEHVVFYIDDMSANFRGSSPDLHGREYSGLYPPTISGRSQRSNSVYSQSAKPRRSRGSLDVEALSNRRSSVSSRSRANSYNRPTPLGDGRRASIYKNRRPRRASTVRRKDSVCPTKIVKKEHTKIAKDPLVLAQQKRHRRIAMIVLGAFAFLLIASVMVVVVTLTHSSFHSPSSGSKDRDDHRDGEIRKENEELYNSLNRNSSTLPGNATASP